MSKWYMMADCVGYAWRYLEQRGLQNASTSQQKRDYSFVVESDEDDESLLGFMKNVEPHKELIPPPAYLSEHRQLQIRRHQNTGRINLGGVSADPQSTGFPRQKQNSEVTMTANAFSDLDAIAEMGAGEDPDSQSQISGQNTPCLPSFNGGDCTQNLSQIGSNQSTKDFEQRIGKINQISGMQQQNTLLQLSPLEQQRMSLYRQQQQKLLAGVNSYRMMQQSQSALPQSGPEVFDFDDSSNFASAISSPSYQSPGGRCRGRGRRGGGNIGDRQLSFSSLDNESTPGSPSDFQGKKRGVSGQRRPRKSRTREISLASDEKLQFSYQHNTFPPSHYQRQQTIPQQQIANVGHLNYNLVFLSFLASNEEEVRSRMMSEYEMALYESSSSDEEMDPPPPPKNLYRESNEREKVSSETQRGGEKAKIQSKHSGSCEPHLEDPSTQQKLSGDFSLAELSNQQISSLNIPSNEKLQKRLVNAHLTSASSSSSTSASVASSPPQRQGEHILPKTSDDSSKDSRKSSKTSLKAAEDLKEIKQEIKMSSKLYSPFVEFLDDGSSQNISIKKELSNEFEDDENKNKGLIQPKQQLNEIKSKNKSHKIKGGETRKLSSSITEDVNNKKTGKIVLKIKPPREGAVHLPTTKNSTNSSSSPSSSSSSSISTSTNICQTFQQAMEQQPIARLSSSAAPPSKFKQQQKGGIKRLAIDEIIENVKLKKVKKEEKNNQTQQQLQQQKQQPNNNSCLKLTKENVNKQKEGGSTNNNVLSQPPFPSLKNFKIPKVVEAEPSSSSSSQQPLSQQQQIHISSLKTEQQNQRNFSSGEGKINKYSDSSISTSSSSSSSFGGKYGEKKGITWDKTQQQQQNINNYLPQHVRQQKSQKPNKHSINDIKIKKFTGGPQNYERRGPPLPPSSNSSINRNNQQQQSFQQQKQYSIPSTQRDSTTIPSNQPSNFNQNWQQQTSNSFSPQRNWTSSINQSSISSSNSGRSQHQTNVLRYEVNLHQQNARNSPQIDDDGLQIVDED
ncbi:hypothetical protein Mgra_00007783 [Meloidogyne graminicola]|uniref:Uncharacterized protein n=1 Tax=Meloidogyne graminicola TaxID=189291 RepID=A0A8S9ZHL9_9BILA|nr:hypothetical protein Mgra_00007783 [Meloidogyne graminicola]